ncbi:PREDICTED: inversin-like, partial [Apaloderma vittatum]|uniref:inversin-like n=1 Tax=Apaloderma vittatum TaxID=57397 RepID=UPI0005212E91
MNISANCLFSGSSLASEVHAAAVNGDKNTLQKLIAGNSELKDKEDQFGRTPLMYCVLADRLECAEALLKAGADVNRADCSRRTALHLAAQKFGLHKGGYSMVTLFTKEQLSREAFGRIIRYQIPRYQEEALYYEDGEILKQVAWRGGGGPSLEPFMV